MSGILDKDMLQTQSQTGAATRSVQSNELASTQTDNLLAKDSPLRQRAETSGKNYSTSRGLLDSTIGAEAAFGALVDRVIPIATTDANRYAEVADQNLSFENQFKIADKNFGQQGLLQKDDQSWRASENAADLP